MKHYLFQYKVLLFEFWRWLINSRNYSKLGGCGQGGGTHHEEGSEGCGHVVAVGMNSSEGHKLTNGDIMDFLHSTAERTDQLMKKILEAYNFQSIFFQIKNNNMCFNSWVYH